MYIYGNILRVEIENCQEINQVTVNTCRQVIHKAKQREPNFDRIYVPCPRSSMKSQFPISVHFRFHVFIQSMHSTFISEMRIFPISWELVIYFIE